MFLVYRILLTLLLLFCLAPCAMARDISIIASGDILLDGSAAPLLKRYGFDYAFDATRDVLTSADLTLGNLEAPLTNSQDEFTDKRFRFKVSSAAAEALKNAGYDVLTLANNHMGDFGHQGVNDTVDSLHAVGLKSTGAGADITQAREPALVEIDGTTIALLAYSNTFPKAFYATKSRPGTAPGYPSYFIHDIKKARKRADVVIVSFHWGGEALTTPKDYQQDLGRRAIEAGAQVVIGHHPHVLQGVELYRDGVIYYSLGNFAFGSYSKTARTSALARITLRDARLLKAELLPLDVYNIEVAFQPRPLQQEPADAFSRDFKELCDPFGTTLEHQADAFWKVTPQDPDTVEASDSEPDTAPATEMPANNTPPVTED